MGAPLARLEARLALGELVARVADFDTTRPALNGCTPFNVRGFARLPTTLRPR